MKHLFLLILLVAGVSLRGEAPTTQPMPLPTSAELQQMHDAGQYRVCLQQIARVLQLRGDVAKPYDYFALLLLRGDCLLHLEDADTALEAYASAEKSADPKQKMEARATIVLMRNSPRLLFTPKAPSESGPISVIDHANRKKAMVALHDQLLKEAKPLIEGSLGAHSLIPVLDAAPALIDIDCLEITATGSNAELHPTLLKIGDHTRQMITDELVVIDKRVAKVQASANESADIGTYGAWWGGSIRRGLTTDDRASLRNDSNYADHITNVVEQFQQTSRSLGGTGEKWVPILEQSLQVAQHARSVLAAE